MLINTPTIVLAAYSHAARLQQVCEFGVGGFVVVKDCHEGTVEVGDDDVGVTASTVVEFGHCLVEEAVVETDEGVDTVVALLEGRDGSEGREATQGLEGCHHHLLHPQAVKTL